MKLKRIISGIVTVLVVAVYLLSVGGINVHSCSHTGETYVTFLFEGTDCESVHGGAGHCECSCHGHHHHHTADADGCCHNRSVQLSLTGDDDHSQAGHIAAPSPVAVTPVSAPAALSAGEPRVVNAPRPWASPHIPDILHLSCLFRC